MLLVQLCARFQSLPPLSTSKLGPSGADSRVGGVVYILGTCGSLQSTLLWGWEFLMPPQPPQVFSVRDFEALFPQPGTLGCMVCVVPQFFLLVYPHANVGPPSLPATASPDLPSAASPTGSSSCRLAACPLCPSCLSLPLLPVWMNVSLTSWLLDFHTVWFLWQFWLFFVFKFVVVFLLVVWGGRVYLPTPLSWPEFLRLLFK